MNTSTPTSSRPFPAWGVFWAALVLLSFAFHIDEFIGFQSRFGLFAQEMLRQGPSFFPPTYGMPDADYPATSTFIIYLLALIVGTLTPFVAIFPTLLASSLILMYVYKIGTLHTQRLGFVAVCMTLLAFGFWQEARTIALDQYISLITIVSFYWVYQQKFRTEKHLFWRWILLWSLGFAIRGPIGIVVPCVVVCGFYFLEKRWRDFIVTAILGIILILCFGKSLLGLGFLQGGSAFVDEILHMQVSSRVDGISIKSLSSYFLSSLGDYAILYPFCVAIAIVGYSSWLKPGNDPLKQLLRFTFMWAAVILFGFSLASGQKSHYLLPMVPALGLIGACVWLNTFDNPRLQYVKQVFSLLCRHLPLIIALACVVIWGYQRYTVVLWPAAYLNVSLILFGVWLGLRYVSWQDKNIYAAVLTMASTYIFIIEPINLHLNRSFNFVQTVEQLRNKEQAQLAFYQITRDGLAIKYMVQADKPLSPVFVSQWEQLPQQTPRPLLVMLNEETWEKELSAAQKISCTPLAQGNLGHKPVMVCLYP